MEAILVFLIVGVLCLLISHISTDEDEQQYKSEYDRLLHTPQWYEFRQKILKQHYNECDWCGRHNHLQIHHKYYLKTPNNKHINPWDYPDEAMMCLCESCHKKAHNIYKIKTYYTKYK